MVLTVIHSINCRVNKNSLVNGIMKTPTHEVAEFLYLYTIERSLQLSELLKFCDNCLPGYNHPQISPLGPINAIRLINWYTVLNNDHSLKSIFLIHVIHHLHFHHKLSSQRCLYRCNASTLFPCRLGGCNDRIGKNVYT